MLCIHGCHVHPLDALRVGLNLVGSVGFCLLQHEVSKPFSTGIRASAGPCQVTGGSCAIAPIYAPSRTPESLEQNRLFCLDVKMSGLSHLCSKTRLRLHCLKGAKWAAATLAAAAWRAVASGGAANSPPSPVLAANIFSQTAMFLLICAVPVNPDSNSCCSTTSQPPYPCCQALQAQATGSLFHPHSSPVPLPVANAEGRNNTGSRSNTQLT